MARVPYVDADEMPQEYPGIAELGELVDLDIDADRYNDNNAVKAMANNVPIMKFHLYFYRGILEVSGLPPEETELLVLKTARELGGEHTWRHHVPKVNYLDLTEDDIIAISNRDDHHWTGKNKALIQYATDFIDGEVNNETHLQLKRYYDDNEIVAIGMILGYYMGHVRMGLALGVELEEVYEGQNVENAVRHDRLSEGR